MIRMKAERLRRKWTQTVLAYHGGVTAQEISIIENGWKRPFPKHAKRLAEVLDLAPEDLLVEVKDAVNRV